MQSLDKVAKPALAPATSRSGGQLREKIGLILVSGVLYAIAIASVDMAANHIPPVTLTALRLGAASTIFCVILFFLRPVYRWSWRGAADIAIVGVLNVGIPFLMLALAVRYISGSLAAVLFNVQPVITVVLAHLLLADEKLNRPKFIGTLVAVSGATLLVLRSETGLAAGHSQGWIGQALILLASLAGSLGVVYTRIRLRGVHSVVLASGQVFACLVIFVGLALAVEGIPAVGSYAWQGWAALVGATLSAPVLGFWLLFYMINKYSASLAGFAGIATPLFSAMIGILWLGEVITAPIALGALLLLAGVWSLNYF